MALQGPKVPLFGPSPQLPRLSTKAHPELSSHFKGNIVGECYKCGRVVVTSHLVHRKTYFPAFKEVVLGPTVYKRRMETALFSNTEAKDPNNRFGETDSNCYLLTWKTLVTTNLSL